VALDCGSQNGTSTLCGSDHTVIASTFYQLTGAPIRLRPPQTAPPTGGSITDVWLTRPHDGSNERVVGTGPKLLQVRKPSNDLIIDPMNDVVNGTQYKYVVQFSNETREYETERSTAGLGST
jgi:hypothetical protein